MELTVLPELKSWLRPLTGEELTELAESLKEEGCRDPIRVWRRGDELIVIGGHHRKIVCDAEGIGYEIDILEFDDIEDVKDWMDRDQLKNDAGRKSDEEYKRVLRGRIYNRLKARTSNPDGGNQYKKVVDGQLDHQPKTTSETLSNEFGASEKTIRRDAVRAEVHDAVIDDEEAATAAVKLKQKDIEAAKKAAEAGSDSEEEKSAKLAAELKSRAKLSVPGHVRENGCKELVELVEAGQVSETIAMNFVTQVPGIDQQRKIVAKGADAVKVAARPTKKDGDKAEPAPKLVPALKQKDITEIRDRLVFTSDETKAKLADYILMLVPDQPLNKKTAEGFLRRLEKSPDTVKEVVVLGSLKYEAPDKLLAKLKKWADKTFGVATTARSKPTLEEVREYALILVKKDPGKYATAIKQAENYWHDCESKGWKFGPDAKHLKPIENWKSRFVQFLGWQKDRNGGGGQADMDTPIIPIRDRPRRPKRSERERERAQKNGE